MADLEGGNNPSRPSSRARRTPPRLSSHTERTRSPESPRDNSSLLLRMSGRCSRSTIRPSALSSTVCSTA